MPVVDATHLDGFLRRLSQRHARAAALPEHLLVGDIVLFRTAAEALGGDLLQALLSLHRNRMRRASHRVRSLASAGYAGPGQMLGVRAPAHIALLPRYAEDFGCHAVNVDHRFGPKVSNSRLEAEAAVRFDQHQAVKSD